MNMQNADMKSAQMEMRWSREGHLIFLIKGDSKRGAGVEQNRAEYKENETGDCSQAGYKGKKLEKTPAERSLWSGSLG